MASVSFTLPMNPVMISAAKKSGSFLGLLLNIVILVALVAFIWWFYKAMRKSGASQLVPPPAPAPAPEPAPPVEEEQFPEGAGAPESVPSADM